MVGPRNSKRHNGSCTSCYAAHGRCCVTHLAGRRHNAKGRSTGRFSNSRFKKMNKPPVGEPWIWLTREILESCAWRALSHAGQKIVFRVILEHLAHGGSQNGDLPVTYRDFEHYGVGSNSIYPALS